LNTMVYGQLFPGGSDSELESLHRLGRRWKVNIILYALTSLTSISAI
jgi:hypothetical protein